MMMVRLSCLSPMCVCGSYEEQPGAGPPSVQGKDLLLILDRWSALDCMLLLLLLLQIPFLVPRTQGVPWSGRVKWSTGQRSFLLLYFCFFSSPALEIIAALPNDVSRGSGVVGAAYECRGAVKRRRESTAQEGRNYLSWELYQCIHVDVHFPRFSSTHHHPRPRCPPHPLLFPSWNIMSFNCEEFPENSLNPLCVDELMAAPPAAAVPAATGDLHPPLISLAIYQDAPHHE